MVVGEVVEVTTALVACQIENDLFASTSRSFKTLIPYLGTGQHFLNSAVCILTWTNLSFTVVGQMLLNTKNKIKKLIIDLSRNVPLTYVHTS